MRVSMTQRGQSESVSRGHPSGGLVRSWLLSSGPGAHPGAGDGLSGIRVFTAWNPRHPRFASSRIRASARSFMGSLPVCLGHWNGRPPSRVRTWRRWWGSLLGARAGEARGPRTGARRSQPATREARPRSSCIRRAARSSVSGGPTTRLGRSSTSSASRWGVPMTTVVSPSLTAPIARARGRPAADVDDVGRGDVAGSRRLAPPQSSRPLNQISACVETSHDEAPSTRRVA